MCGIIASIGKKELSFFHNLCGLKQLQNRGYDSAGICSMSNNQFITTKYASTDKETSLVLVEGEKENIINIKNNHSFQDFLSIIPLQILAYKLSLARDLNPDMPRNLAKVVTVE